METEENPYFTGICRLRMLFILYVISIIVDPAIILYYLISNKVTYYLQLWIFSYIVIKVVLFSVMLLLLIKQVSDYNKKEQLGDGIIYISEEINRTQILLCIGCICNLLCGSVLLLVNFMWKDDMNIPIAILLIPNVIIMLVAIKNYIIKTKNNMDEMHFSRDNEWFESR